MQTDFNLKHLYTFKKCPFLFHFLSMYRFKNNINQRMLGCILKIIESYIDKLEKGENFNTEFYIEHYTDKYNLKIKKNFITSIIRNFLYFFKINSGFKMYKNLKLNPNFSSEQIIVEIPYLLEYEHHLEILEIKIVSNIFDTSWFHKQDDYMFMFKKAIEEEFKSKKVLNYNLVVLRRKNSYIPKMNNYGKLCNIDFDRQVTNTPHLMKSIQDNNLDASKMGGLLHKVKQYDKYFYQQYKFDLDNTMYCERIEELENVIENIKFSYNRNYFIKNNNESVCSSCCLRKYCFTLKRDTRNEFIDNNFEIYI